MLSPVDNLLSWPYALGRRATVASVTEPAQFVTMRLTGSRFGQAGMPVEVLPELAAYRDLIVTVARELFLSRNPGRQRVPRGFAESFQLRLERVDKGSAIPVLERVSTEVNLFPDIDDFFAESRDAVQAAILSVASSGRLPEDFPPTALSEFSKFGRTLRAGEFIELSSSTLSRPARYSAAVRRILVGSKARSYLQETSVDGMITEVNSERSSFLLRTGPQLVPCTFEGELFESVVSKIRPADEDGIPVRIEGIVSFNPQDSPIAIPFVTGITALDGDEDDPYPLPGKLSRIDSEESDDALTQALDRLNSLQSLPSGWLDGGGAKISPDVVSYARRIISNVDRATLAGIRIYPTEDGGIRLEWRRFSTDFSLDFQPDRSVLYDEVDSDTGSETERKLSFEESRDVRVLLVGG